MPPNTSAHRVFTASNVISLVRLALTLPVALAILSNWYLTAFALCWLAAFTDWLDGYVARRTSTVSEWGKVFDPLADKVLVGTVVVLLLIKGLLPVWFVMAVVVRDVIILIAAAWARTRLPSVLPSLWSGKLAVSGIALTGVLSMILSGWWLSLLMYITCLVMGVSLWDYAKRLHGLLRQD